MTDLPPFIDELTRCEYRVSNWHGTEREAQERAEREGHVPPGTGPVEVGHWAYSYDYRWQWFLGKDTTGQLKEMWLSDGPLVGRHPRAIPASAEVGEQVAVPNDRDDDPNAPTSYAYELHEREDGLWYGRWVA